MLIYSSAIVLGFQCFSIHKRLLYPFSRIECIPESINSTNLFCKFEMLTLINGLVWEFDEFKRIFSTSGPIEHTVAIPIPKDSNPDL